MPRETKTQRLAREESEKQIRLEEAILTYPMRLMTMLERATNSNYQITVVDLKFYLIDRDDTDNVFELSINYDDMSEINLIEMDWQISNKEDREREIKKQIELRKSALSKLTDEERKALNV